MKHDIAIAQAAKIRPIGEIGEILGIPKDDLELYGKFKAKIPLSFIDEEKIQQVQAGSCYCHNTLLLQEKVRQQLQ